jgi:hypothetical protein
MRARGRGGGVDVGAGDARARYHVAIRPIGEGFGERGVAEVLRPRQLVEAVIGIGPVVRPARAKPVNGGNAALGVAGVGIGGDVAAGGGAGGDASQPAARGRRRRIR